MPSPSRVLTDERIERLAAGLHRVGAGADGPGWEAASDGARRASLDGARGIAGHLEVLGLDLREVDAPRNPPLTAAQEEAAARAEHDRWAAYTRRLGYRPGPVRDDATLVHPDLVAWEDLDDQTRDKDRIRVRALPRLLAEVGLEVVVR